METEVSTAFRSGRRPELQKLGESAVWCGDVYASWTNASLASDSPTTRVR